MSAEPTESVADFASATTDCNGPADIGWKTITNIKLLSRKQLEEGWKLAAMSILPGQSVNIAMHIQKLSVTQQKHKDNIKQTKR